MYNYLRTHAASNPHMAPCSSELAFRKLINFRLVFPSPRVSHCVCLIPWSWEVPSPFWLRRPFSLFGFVHFPNAVSRLPFTVRDGKFLLSSHFALMVKGSIGQITATRSACTQINKERVGTTETDSTSNNCNDKNDASGIPKGCGKNSGVLKIAIRLRNYNRWCLNGTPAPKCERKTKVLFFQMCDNMCWIHMFGALVFALFICHFPSMLIETKRIPKSKKTKSCLWEQLCVSDPSQIRSKVCKLPVSSVKVCREGRLL